MRWTLKILGIVILVIVLAASITIAVFATRGDAFLTNRLGILTETSRTPIGDTGYARIDSVLLKDDRGLEVYGYLRIPHGDGPYPVVVLLAGLNTGRESLDWVMEVEQTRQMAFFTLDYPYQGKTQFKNLDFLANIGPIYQALFDGVNAGIYARRYLTEIPEIDPERIFIIGVSFGAFYSVVSGGLDPKFRMVGAYFGGADFAELLHHNMARQGILKFPPMRWLASRTAALILQPLEPTYWAPKIAPRPFLMINGHQDAQIPKQYVMELYQSAGEPKKLVWVDSQHIDRQGPAIVPELVRESAAWLLELGLLEPIISEVTP